LGVLHKFASTYRKPQGLPLVRSHDHAIPLISGVALVKIHPYRYPFSYKTEIEKIVQELLHDNFIQPNISPFLSPIILVQKKNSSWQICNDYRALNAVTVKDCFPIPTIDELLDELHGAQFFSKLDLCSGYH